MSSYSDKLKDPRWQKMRLEILQRDNFTCVMCEAADKTLHVHHRYYVKGHEPWEYSPDALVTLCFACHEEMESQLAFVARHVEMKNGLRLLTGYMVQELAQLGIRGPVASGCLMHGSAEFWDRIFAERGGMFPIADHSEPEIDECLCAAATG